MEKVLFNLSNTQPSGSIKRHGGGKYGEIVFMEIIDRKYPVVGMYDSKRWMNPSIVSAIKENNIPLYDMNKFSVKEIVQKEAITTFYTPLVYEGIIKDYGCRIVGTIHGLRTFEFIKDSFSKKYKKKSSILRRCLNFITLKDEIKEQRVFLNRILGLDFFHPVTVSRHTASAIKTYFPTYKDLSIPVFYSPSTTTSENHILERKHEEKYFLLVSGSIPHKNNLRAIIAFDRLLSNGYLKDFRVKITGVSDFSIFKYKINNKDKFDILGYVEESELSQLYHDSYCFVYPTLSEGFGYPPIEAMQYGIPVLASPHTSVTEVLGDAAIYFNPFSIEEIMNRILQITENNCHDEYTKKSFNRYKIITEKQNSDLKHLVDYIYNV